MEIKGLITVAGSKHLTCCDSVPDIYIGKESLYDFLDNNGGLDSQPREDDGDYDEYEKNHKLQVQWNVRYVVQDTPFEEQQTFEDVAARAQIAMISSSVVGVCYSEWTCGVGTYDFDLGGHSIFKELEDKENKYIWIKFDNN